MRPTQHPAPTRANPSRDPRRPRIRWTLAIVAFGLPVIWLSPGCGARSPLGPEGSGGLGGGGGSGGSDAGPDTQVDVTIDVLPDVPVDVPVDVGFDVPFDVPADVPFDVPADVPFDVPIDVPADVPFDVPADVPEDVPADVPIDVPADVPADVPIDVVSDGPCPDNDHDGWSTCDGDCDDGNPLVNPGAYDFVNGIDDDCDGAADNAVTDCSAGLPGGSQNPHDYALAIEICQDTAASEPLPQRRWGLISSQLLLSDGSGAPSPQSHAIVGSFGSVIQPRKNANMAYFSTGIADIPADPQPGTQNLPQPAALPQGFPTNKGGCQLPTGGAFDSVNLKLTIRVPTNAESFAFDHSFFSAEYPEWACTQYNDMWVVLLQTTAGGIANNHDIVFDATGTPGSVNLSFFDRCVAGPTGCSGSVPGFNFCAGGTADLTGTGYGDSDFQCNVNTSTGGGTGWMTTESPVTPGETIVLQFMVWDSSDGVYDSAAIFDNFRWQQNKLANPTTHR